jgi:hypothetical protein
MLAALAVSWTFLVLRASIAAIFGTVVLVWPGLTPWQLVMLFGAYVAVDGVLALIVAFNVKGLPGFGSLLFEALVRLGVAICAFAAPGRTALSLDARCSPRGPSRAASRRLLRRLRSVAMSQGHMRFHEDRSSANPGGAIILVALVRIIVSVADTLVLRTLNPLDHTVFQRGGIIHTKMVLLIALLALVRKVIVVDGRC